jgi:hypothetical protein
MAASVNLHEFYRTGVSSFMQLSQTIFSKKACDRDLSSLSESDAPRLSAFRRPILKIKKEMPKLGWNISYFEFLDRKENKIKP